MLDWFQNEFDYEPRLKTPQETYNEKLLRQADEIEDALRWDITLTVDKYNNLLTNLLSLITRVWTTKN